MKPFFSFLFFLFFFQTAVFAQLELSGVWQGTITIGGINTNRGYPIELHIKKRGRRITGYSLVHLSSELTIEMELSGRMYDDLSVYFDEIKFIGDETSIPPFLRTYQLIWHRSIGDRSTLNGYWQEIQNDVLGERREKGRIFLTKAPPGKA